MPTEKKLNQETAERAKPAQAPDGTLKDAIYWDKGLKGFGLVCRKNGETKTWIMQREIQGKTARTTLGHFPEMSAADARKAAESESSKMKSGFNPHQARAAEMTLEVAFKDYIKARVDLRPKTVDLYEQGFRLYLGPVKDVPLYDLGKNPRRVADLFAEVTRKHGKGAANQVGQLIRMVYNREADMHENWPRNPVRAKSSLFKMHKLKPRQTVIPYDKYENWARDVMTIANPIRRCGRLFLLLTGMRDDATCQMRWEHIDWTEGKETLLVPEPMGGELHEFRFPLSTQVVEILKRLKVYSTEEWAFPGSPWCFPAIVTGGKVGQIYDFKESRRPGVLNPHAMRRTFSTRAADMVPKKHISFLINHNLEKATITDQYIVAEMEPLRRSQQIISDYIMSMLKVPLEEILGPIHSGTKQTYGKLPPWGRKGQIVARRMAKQAKSKAATA